MKPIAIATASTDFAGGGHKSQLLVEGGGWADRFSIGQIIKGRVLRQYSESRYEVAFGGRPRIVDSAVPLAVGSELQGRITGLGTRVTIERLPDGKPTPAPLLDGADARTRQAAGDPAMALANELRVTLSSAEARTISAAAVQSGDSALTTRLGVLLAKLGVPVDRDALRMIRSFADDGMPLTRTAIERAVAIATAPESGAGADAGASSGNAETLGALAQWVSDVAGMDGDAPAADGPSAEDSEQAPGRDSSPHADADGGDDERDRQGFRRWIWTVLNVQDGSALAHRYQTLPVMIDGQLKEFDLALFEHAVKDDAGVSTRRICLSLDTAFGQVSIDARVANDRVGLSVASERAVLSEALMSDSKHLKACLRRAGWQLGEADYHVGTGVMPAATVADHMLAHDSLLKVL